MALTIGRRRARWAVGITAVLVPVGVAAIVVPTTASPAAPPAEIGGRVAFVQAVPGATFNIAVDGRSVGSSVEGRTLVEPVTLTPGRHTVTFNTGDTSTRASFRVAAGSSSDVVLHRPASVGQKPVISVYQTPTDPIAPGRSRLLLAHTALAPPADVRVDGETVFTNITNGEFATADLAAGRHRAALVLSGTRSTILGPLPLRLRPGTATMVYAVGSPKAGSMDVVTRTVGLRRDGTVAPTQVDTGEIGLVSATLPRTFSSDVPGSP